MTTALLNQLVALGCLLSACCIALRYRRLKHQYDIFLGAMIFLMAIFHFVLSFFTFHTGFPLHSTQTIFGLSALTCYGCIVIAFFLREIWLALPRHNEKASHDVAD